MSRTQSIDQIVIRAKQNSAFQGTIYANHRHFNCKIGINSINYKIREGDNITPIGNWSMSYFLYRPDKHSKPKSFLSGFPIGPNDSWCNVKLSNRYNQPLGFTPPNSSEALWRKDNLYDLIIVLDHNSLPFISGRGSAIFIHLSNPKTLFTHGCIALNSNDMINLLAMSSPNTKVRIE